MDINLSYNPAIAQQSFHSTDKKFRLYSGAVRAGKSYAGSHEALKLSFMYEKNVGIIARKDYTSLRDSTMVTFFQVCPKELISSYNKTEHLLEFVNGSKIYFKDLKEPDKIKSMEVGWFWIDEATECKKESFEILQSRLSLNTVDSHYGFLTTNPDSLNNWVYDFFYKNPSNEKEIIETNTYQMKEFLPKGYIESLEKNLSSENVKRLLEGKWGIFEGLIYKDFEYSKNVFKSLEKFLYVHKRFICGVDWGFEHYGSMNLIDVMENTLTGEEHYFIIESVSERLQLIEFWIDKAIYWQKKYGSILFYCDTARPDNITEFKRKGIIALGANKEVISGINSVASCFKNGTLHIINTATKLIEEVQSYKWKQNSNNEEPIKENDDNVDSVRYAIHTDKMKYGVKTGVLFGSKKK